MKERTQIAFKLLRKQVIPLFLLIMIVALFCINFFNKPIVYASEQIANVKCDVSLINGESIQLLSSDEQAISTIESSVINFSDINAELSARSKIEFKYLIENITTEDCVFNLKLNKNIIENFKIEYFVDSNLNGDFTSFGSVLKSSESIEVRVLICVENIARDAILNGSLELTLESIGGDNG